MPIFHMRTHVISRTNASNRYSVVAAAAYRSGQKFVFGAAGTAQSCTYNYTNKSGVVATEVLVPEGVPMWASNREGLWNAVEVAEKRKDAQLAREIEVALPVELERSRQLELVREFAQSEFVKLGMIADICVHDKGDGNPHCHIMLTMREITKNGFSAKKNRDWNQRDLVTKWRKSWETCVNSALERCGINEKVSCESLEEQGISDRIPQIHMGSKDARDSGHEARRVRNEDIKAYNMAYAELKVLDVEVDKIEKQIAKLRSAEERKVGGTDSVIGELSLKIQAQEIEKREAYDIAFSTYRSLKESEPSSMLGFLGFESREHREWERKLEEVRENVLEKWEACGGNRHDKDMGEAEVDRRLTLEYALDEAKKVLVNAEKTFVKKEAGERHKQKLEGVKVEASTEAKARDTVVVAEGERVTCHIIGGKASITATVHKISEDKIVLRSGETQFTLKREKVYFTQPGPQQQEKSQWYDRKRVRGQDLGR